MVLFGVSIISLLFDMGTGMILNTKVLFSETSLEILFLFNDMNRIQV